MRDRFQWQNIPNLEAGHVSCDSPERRVHHHIVRLGHGDGYEGG